MRYGRNTVATVRAINAELEKIQQSINTMLDRDGTSPNQMEDLIDMNSNRIINLPQPISSSEPLRLQDLVDIENGTFVTRDTQELTAGQTEVVSLVNVDAATIHISDGVIDSRQLVKGVEYIVQDDNTFILDQTYPEGTYIIIEGGLVTNVDEDTSPYTLRTAPEVNAHRGFRDIGFENTLLSLSKSFSQGADSLECDCSISADGVWYLFHDATVDALTDGTGTFTSLDSSYIDTLQYTAASSTGYAPLRITRLDDFLLYAKQSRLYFYPEIKNRRSASDVTDLYNVIKDNKLLEQCTFQSFILTDLQILRNLDARVVLGWLVDSTDIAGNIQAARSAGINDLLYNKTTLIQNPTFTQQILDAGLGLMAWTINKKEEAISLYNQGCVRMICDRNINFDRRGL